MAKILVGGAGGAPSEGVIKSLQLAGYHVIGMGSDPTDLILSSAQKRYLVPRADSPEYEARLQEILDIESPDLVHFQNDLEVFHGSRMRQSIEFLSERVFMPEHNVIDAGVHKFETWRLFKRAGLAVPMNILIDSPVRLVEAFDALGDSEGRIWLRSVDIGGGGKGALPTSSYEMAKAWLEHYQGWGKFAAAEFLTGPSVTWSSIWYHGELVVAQGRSRLAWTHGDRTISGVTGVTKVGLTVSDTQVDDISIAAVRALSPTPHGIFSVDLTYDDAGIPNPTEINIARFFTTILFFTTAGLNLPKIYVDLALFGTRPEFQDILSPLPPDLVWFRGMDREPLLSNRASFDQWVNSIR